MNRAAERRGGWGVGGFAAVCMGLGLTCLGIFLLLSFATADVAMDLASAAKTCWTGLLGVWVAYGTIHTLGTAASVLMAMLITFWGLLVAKTMRWFATWPQVVGGVLMLAAVSLGVCGLADSYDMDTGGLLAIYVSPPAVLYFGRWGLVLAAAGVLIVGILLAFGETAVYSVHWAVYCVRDGFFGIIAIIGRLFELVKMLFTPRLAVAGGVAAGSATTTRSAGRRLRRGKEKNLSAAAESRDTEEAEEPDDGEEGGNLDDTVEEEISGAMEQEPRPELKEWKPREGFQSRYLNLDLRHDATQPEQPEPAPAQPAPELKPEPEPVTAAIAPQPQPGETGEFPSGKTVIMDVDAEAEESDVVAPDQPAAESAAAGINDTIPDNPAPTIVQNSAGPILVDPLDSADADGSGYPAAGTDPVPATPPLDSIAAAIQPRSAPAAQPEPARPTVAPRPNAAAAASGIKPSRPGAYGVREEKPPVQTDDLANYRLPPLELLDPPEPPVVEDVSLIEAKAKILEQTLAEFKIEGRVVHVERGPRVTLYEISLAPGIRLNKVTSLADNIAMQLKAESIRIIAPIPGKNTIGIEIPNTNKELVSLKEIVSAVNRDKRRQALPICLGKDISGSALVADLARMPHLLIAGATGSGKSVCINS
ncbi:MAG: hypothetical protein LIP23_00485, partial [Planctomycetes bacterium]|nr:hypothetical protein [Planctomycetota bacterium]